MPGIEDGTSPIGLPVRVATSDGSAVAKEMVAVSRLDRNRYRVLLSPGLCKGIAAGDEVEYDAISKSVKVVSRGGNIAIQVYYQGISAEIIGRFKEGVIGAGGSIDGESNGLIVVTFPGRAGFPKIEALMATLPKRGVEWEYGNVFDDDGNPLGWWDGDPAES